MSSDEVSVSGAFYCLFPATTVESLTLILSRSDLLFFFFTIIVFLYTVSGQLSGDSGNETRTKDTASG